MKPRNSSRFSWGGFVKRIGLHRPELRGWVSYDWANSAVMTIIIAAVFPIYFERVAGEGLQPGAAAQRFAVATVVAMIGLVLVAPLLAALADYLPIKKKMVAVFLCIGAPATSAMFFIHTGDWLLALGLFMVVQFSLTATFIFYDSMLPHIAAPDEMDRLSSAGYAIGYLGGGLLLGLVVAWIQFPHWFGLPHGEELTDAQATLPMRLAFLVAGVWWLVFSIPFFLFTPEPSAPGQRGGGVGETLRRSFGQLQRTVRTLRKYRHAGRMLIAFLIYNEGILTIIRMAAIYGAEIGIDEGAMMGSILLVQFVGIPCTVMFGGVAGLMGTRPTIFVGLGVYLLISVFAFFLQTALHFLVLALLVGMVQGGTQALSRSLFASMIPKQASVEFFAVYGLSEKLAGMLGPGLFALMITLTGSSRHAILSVLVFFIVGGLLLSRVDVEEGRRIAREAAREGK